MKTKLFILLLAGMCFLLLIASCEKESDEMMHEMLEVRVKSSDWKLYEDSDETFMYADVNIPELTQSVYDTGLVLVYFVHPITSGKGKELLPYIETWIEEGYGTFVETYSFRYTPGVIRFILEADDASYVPNPKPVIFNVYLTGKK